MRNVCEIFRRYKGQPVEVIMYDFRVVGIIVEADEYGTTLVDKKGRVVRVLNDEIEAIIEPQMHLKRVFGNDDEGFDCECGRGCGCGTSYSYREKGCHPSCTPEPFVADCGCGCGGYGYDRKPCCDGIEDAF